VKGNVVVIMTVLGIFGVSITMLARDIRRDNRKPKEPEQK
jgi:hypothetical protein